MDRLARPKPCQVAIECEKTAVRQVATARRPPVQPNRIDDIGRHVGAGLRPQAIDQSQDCREQPPWNRKLGKLERDLPTVPHDFGADLDQLLAQRSHRPALDLLRQPHERPLRVISGSRMRSHECPLLGEERT